MLEAFLNLLRGEPAGEIVFTADITYWIAGRKADGTARPEWDTEEGFLQLHRELGILPYYYYEKFWAFEAQYDASIEVESSSSGHTTIRAMRTPVGTLAEESVYLPDSCSVGCTRHFLSEPKDLKVLRYVLERRRLVPACLDDYPARRRLWASYDGLPPLGLPRSPLAAMCYEWAGVANTVYWLMDCEDELTSIFSLMEEQEEPILDAVCRLAPPLVHFPDNLSSDNLASLYDRYMAPDHRRRIDRLREAGVACAVHLDGTVRGLLPRLIGAGFDAIEALTPKPAGDLTIDEIAALAGPWPGVLWGGVPGVLFAPPFTWEQMEEHVRHLVESWGRRPFIIGVADQIPPDGNVERCRQIAQWIASLSA
jgi:hypothetical protein